VWRAPLFFRNGCGLARIGDLNSFLLRADEVIE